MEVRRPEAGPHGLLRSNHGDAEPDVVEAAIRLEPQPRRGPTCPAIVAPPASSRPPSRAPAAAAGDSLADAVRPAQGAVHRRAAAAARLPDLAAVGAHAALALIGRAGVVVARARRPVGLRRPHAVPGAARVRTGAGVVVVAGGPVDPSGPLEARFRVFPDATIQGLNGLPKRL